MTIHETTRILTKKTGYVLFVSFVDLTLVLLAIS
jgi:hypothetical protein